MKGYTLFYWYFKLNLQRTLYVTQFLRRKKPSSGIAETAVMFMKVLRRLIIALHVTIRRLIMRYFVKTINIL